MPAPKKNILVKYLLNREHGTLSFSESCALANSDGQAVAEEKSTIPVINKVIYRDITIVCHQTS